MERLRRGRKALAEDPVREDLILGVAVGLIAALVWTVVATPAHVLLYASFGIVVGVVYVAPIAVWLTRRSARRHHHLDR